MKYHISAKAYTKMLLHAAKYPHKAVNGVLLGEESIQDSEVYAQDAIPLFHQCLGLAPMLEVALNQVDSYCKASGLQIVGYFQANEHIDNNSPDGIAYKIGEKITDHCANGCLLMIDNTKLSVSCDDVAIKCYIVQDNKWKLIDKDLSVAGGDDTLNLTSDLIEGKAYQSLVDFDNHLDDMSLDWLNHDINRLADLTG
ncbi:ER membrane protein complex subunit 8 [Exaiptasia diaphana]|uniref:MPN domain-containing protein n=1 Tax=Exaiptasia diaphana TaxID=2652724 RepID=A0A913XV58_EXADI|nr:ER membrane protein complex subunit 8 [Exaiptasia diaphana]KXJ24279.1 ER membrane protein complex subunit 8 [Exaiptasia diaphana]